MKRDTAIDILRRHRAELAAVGVAHAYLFGSVARDEAGEDSDVDVMIDVFNNDRFSLLDIVHVKHTLEDILIKNVDVYIRGDALKSKKLLNAADQALHVF